MVKDIFVSYRRSDSSAIVGRVIDRLETLFGQERIFRDLDSIDYGQDFEDVITHALAHCEVLLVVIGDEWVSAADETGERRLDNVGDWVRLEVSKALAQGVRVIPVLVQKAEMPSASHLPDDLKPLAKRNAARVRDDPDFNGDMERLCEAIKRSLAHKPPHLPVRSRKPLLLVGAAVILAATVVGSQYDWTSIPGNGPNSTGDETTGEATGTLEPLGKLHFLGIGINSYPFMTIAFAHKDIEYLQETLRDGNPESRLGEFVSLYNSDATRARVIYEIKNIRERLGRDDVAIIAFAGMEEIRGRFYLLPYDADLTALEGTAISADDIFSVMPNTKGDVVFLLDTCQSEQFGNELERINPSIITLASCSKTEVAIEGIFFRSGGGGAFTTAIGKGLKGAADRNGDEWVTLAELAVFTRAETPRIMKGQHPVIIGDLLPIVLTAADHEK